MSAEEPPLPQPSIDLVEEDRMWVYDGSQWVRLAGDSNGNLTTSDPSNAEVTDTQDQTDVNASTYTNQFDVVPEMDSVSVAVDDATGAFHVEVRFQDGNGNEIVTRGGASVTDFSGDGSTDVFVDVEIAAPQVEVAVVDDSGAANTVDITLRAD